MAGQSRLASISDYGSVQSSSWMENVDDTLSHITEKVWVNLNVWSFLWWTSFQYCRPSGLQCTSHFVFRSSPPASRTTLSRPQAEKQWKESQNAARFCAFCTLLKQDFPVSTHQSRSVCDLCWICRFFAWKYARAHCDILHSKERTSGARQLQDRETCWFDGGIDVSEVFGRLESYDDDWCLMFDVIDVTDVSSAWQFAMFSYVFCGQALSGASHFSYWLSNMIYVHQLRCKANL